jgi:hypothetical protein
MSGGFGGLGGGGGGGGGGGKGGGDVSGFDQAAVNAALGTNIQALTNRYNQLGLGGSTMEQQDIGTIPTESGGQTGEADALLGQIQNANLGQSGNQQLQQLAQQQQQQATQIGQQGQAGFAAGAGGATDLTGSGTAGGTGTGA